MKVACGTTVMPSLPFSLHVVMVGLPARGKTYCARKLCRYLQWLGVTTRVFNVGNYRRMQYGARQSHQFFDSANETAKEQRRQAALAALEDMSAWMLRAEARKKTRSLRFLTCSRC